MGFKLKIDENAFSGTYAMTNDLHQEVKNNSVLKPSEKVQKDIITIFENLVKTPNQLTLNEVISFSLTENFIDSVNDSVLYIADNYKLSKVIFKTVLNDFCLENNLGYVLNDGQTAIVYDSNNVLGFIKYSKYTDKTFQFYFLLDVEYVESLRNVIKNDSHIKNTPTVVRMSVDNHGYMDEVKILFNAPKLKIPDTLMYPYLDTSVKDLAVNFMNSTANVLVLYGEPGTGKTTFIKMLLEQIGFENDRTVSIVDTPGVMNSPEMVNSIYTSKTGDIFVFEDVDKHLYSREDGNEIMNGLLNATEGLASPDVKIIISTNIIKLSKIDSALIRDGRCYKTLEFVKLTPEQQDSVLNYIGKDAKNSTTSLSLAETLNEPAVVKSKKSSGFL